MSKLLRRATLVLFLLGQTVLALPVGQWRSDFYGAYGNISLSTDQFVFRLEEEGQPPWTFGGPLVQTIEPSGESPGKLVVGPIKAADYAYEVIWFFPIDQQHTRFFREEKGYQTQAEAEASHPEVKFSDASLFLSREFFDQCDALPVMPEPDKAQLLTLLQEAVQRRKSQSNLDLNTVMEELMIAKGFHPTKSQEPFGKAVDKYGEDPEISSLLTELDS